MNRTHSLLAVAVAVIWGLNFIAIHASLQHFPPFFLVALRWLVIALPTLLLIPRPAVPLRYLIGYGLGFGLLQFLFLYWGMALGMPAGLASLVLQCSAPFTVLLAAIFTGESLRAQRLLGIALACAGLAVVASQRSGVEELWPFFLVVLGGLSWALGNVASRQARTSKPLHFMLWMSVVPPLPMMLIALGVEGSERILDSLLTAWQAPWAVAGLLYTCILATIVGSGIWTWLLSRHPASAVAPFSMLVPVFGMSAAALLLGQQPALLEWLGGLLVMIGVLFASLSPGTLPLRLQSLLQSNSMRTP